MTEKSKFVVSALNLARHSVYGDADSAERMRACTEDCLELLRATCHCAIRFTSSNFESLRELTANDRLLERKEFLKFGHKHVCAFDRCLNVETEEKNFQLCRKCKHTAVRVRSFYCSKSCQLLDWPFHCQFHEDIEMLC